LWGFLHIFTRDGKRGHSEGRVVVQLAHGGEEDGEEGQDEDQDGIWEFFDTEVAHHCDLSYEECGKNAGMNVGPHASSALKIRDIHFQRLQNMSNHKIIILLTTSKVSYNKIACNYKEIFA